MPPARARFRTLGLAVVVCVALVAGCSSGGDEATSPTVTDTPADPGLTRAATHTVEVVRVVPHRRDAFTQGLVWDDGDLLESAGRVGQSNLAIVNPDTGEPQSVRPIDEDLFAEGLALVGERLIQLTWKDEVALVHDRETLQSLGEFTYDGEGWGLCHDGGRLVMSDGSDELTFRDAETFEETGTVAVSLEGEPIARLNELECVGDRVWANVWQTDSIVEIDPESGAVTSVIDASALKGQLDPPPSDGQAVLNGIAFDEVAGTFWLTGKLWPQLFEVRFVPV